MAKKDPTASVDILLQTIRIHHRLTEQEAQVIGTYFNRNLFKRKSTLLQAGQTAHRVYFVVSGILHMYYADERLPAFLALARRASAAFVAVS